ncbi:MAG: chemotaxis response regulator protein-glutamate methylesterase [bacterium]|nr:chemotaxis response regulator protein-glutamate methylesterase [bacterium]
MPVRVMIVDDSNFMRKSISLILSTDPRIEVVSLLASGEEALQQITKVDPDVITLDVNLPGMDGIETLDKIMAKNPKPVIMFSGVTKKGTEVTLKALKKGAVDFVAKPYGCLSPDLSSVREDLIDKVVAASRIRVARRGKAPGKKVDPRKVEARRISEPKKNLLFITSSTGGVQALSKLLPELPGDFPMPVLVVQHMPKMFTKSLAESLDRISALTVTEAGHGDTLEKGHVYIAPGGWHTSVVKDGAGKRIKLEKYPKMKLMPCADVTMSSLPGAYGANVLGLVLTGMGNDGTKGADIVKDAGGMIIAQDEASSMIYGMPRSVTTSGLSDEVWALDEIVGKIVSMLGDYKS